MGQLIQCVPNFSEGRDAKVIEGLLDVAQSVEGVTLIDASSDESHHRTVVTLIGNPTGIEEVAVRLMRYAVEQIDLTTHQGEHPRMGAMDVCPLIPLKGITTEECVEVAKRIGERASEGLALPIFLYEAAASVPARRNLTRIRKGEFEGMTQKLQQPEWQPDYGPSVPHPTAGVTAVGVRQPLVAFNVNLNTADLTIAQEIARAVRGSSGGFKHCKAIGVMLEDQQIAQVSMNMTDTQKLPLYRVFECIKFEAKRYGVSILSSEIIGLTPGQALADSAAYYLQLKTFDYQQQVIENHLI